MHCTQLASVGAEQAHWSIQMDSGVRPASLSKCRECYRDVPQASRTPVITGNQKQAQNTQSPKNPKPKKNQSPKGKKKQSPKGKKKNKSRNRKTKPKRQKKKSKAETEKQNTKAQKTKTTKCHSLSLVAEILCMTARATTGEPSFRERRVALCIRFRWTRIVPWEP